MKSNLAARRLKETVKSELLYSNRSSFYRKMFLLIAPEKIANRLKSSLHKEFNSKPERKMICMKIDRVICNARSPEIEDKISDMTLSHVVGLENLSSDGAKEIITFIWDLIHVSRRRGTDWTSFCDFRKGLKNKIGALNADKDIFLNLSFIAFRLGLFLEAISLREAAYKLVLSPQKQTSYPLADQITAALDAEKLPVAEKLLSNLAKRVTHAEERSFMMLASYVALLGDNALSGSIFKQNLYSQKDREYFAYIQNKSVAVIGPSVTDLELGAEIDSFDVVIRVNFLGKSQIREESKSGSRTDVSYYAKDILTDLHFNRKTEPLRSLDFAIFPHNKYQFQRSLNGRVMTTELPFFVGIPQRVPAILFDLLHFSPRRIKIFNVNFYTSKLAYSYGYRPDFGYDLVFVLGVHDPFSQFKFVKKLYDTNQIEADADTREVLEMSLDEYANRLERVLFNNTVLGIRE